MNGDRREFLRRATLIVAGSALAPALRAQQPAGQQPPGQQPPGQQPAGQQPDTLESSPLAGQGETGTLADPSAAGRGHAPTSAKDNDADIKAVELHLACTCGCTLDVYTCRTTDFTCTYSPAMHREVIALHDEGNTPQQIIDAFVAKYGERVLMAPKPRGFNLAGYLVPGAALTVAGATLVWVVRRRQMLAPAPIRAPAGGGPSASASDASPAELERLERALRESDD